MRFGVITPIAFVLACASASACHSSGASPASESNADSADASSSPPTPPPAVCANFATAICAQLAACDAVTTYMYFGDNPQTCAARLINLCPSVSEEGTSNSPATISACAQSIGALTSCAEYQAYLAANDGNYCPTLPGTLDLGANCSDDSQCASGFCGMLTEDGGITLAGVCVTQPGPGGCQENTNCPTGQICTINGNCVAPGAAGAPCDDSDPDIATQPCLPLFYCNFAGAGGSDAGTGAGDAGTAGSDAGTGAGDAGTSEAGALGDDAGAATMSGTGDGGTLGTCTPVGSAGAACNAEDDVSDCANGLFCNLQGACAPLTFVAIGGACDDVGLVCNDAACVFGSDPTVTTGTCTPFVADGAACNDDNLLCQFGSSCSNGVCTPFE